MSDTMKVRIKGGPAIWQLRVEDVETGRPLPVIDLALRANGIDGALTAEVTLLVHEIDIEVETEVREQIEMIRRTGGIARLKDGAAL